MRNLTKDPIFITALFDCGTDQGLAVSINGKRKAVRVTGEATAAGVVKALRCLADWIESDDVVKSDGKSV